LSKNTASSHFLDKNILTVTSYRVFSDESEEKKVWGFPIVSFFLKKVSCTLCVVLLLRKRSNIPVCCTQLNNWFMRSVMPCLDTPVDEPWSLLRKLQKKIREADFLSVRAQGIGGARSGRAA
jgi:hypothetical protein